MSFKLIHQIDKNLKYELQEESQTLFQRAVQDDTNRRIKDLGDAFCFSYSGANRLERDSITIKTADAIIHMRNNKEVARRMSSQEKSDFLSPTLFVYGESDSSNLAG